MLNERGKEAWENEIRAILAICHREAFQNGRRHGVKPVCTVVWDPWLALRVSRGNPASLFHFSWKVDTYRIGTRLIRLATGKQEDEWQKFLSHDGLLMVAESNYLIHVGKIYLNCSRG